MRPRILNQVWGVYNPDVYKPFGFTQHNGEDERIGADRKVRTQISCFHYKSGFQPNGGGIFVSHLSNEQYEFDDGVKALVLIDYLHLKEILTVEGQKLAIGQPCAIADNTGVTTGEHLHTQYRRVNWNADKTQLFNVDVNEANNSFNPEPYRDGTYADDYYTISILQQLVVLYNELLRLMAIKGRDSNSLNH